MSIRMLGKMLELFSSEAFIIYSKNLTYSILEGLNSSYIDGKGEVDIVKELTSTISQSPNLNFREQNQYISLSTHAVFIHGGKSQIKFQHYSDKNAQCKLADMIYIISLIFNGKKVLEKYTFNQFKKDKSDKLCIWDKIDRTQLYFLSRFPEFTGYSGYIPKDKSYIIPNYSNCLGSYSLLHYPGDFVFISAPRLSAFLGDKKGTSLQELGILWEKEYKLIHPFVDPLNSRRALEELHFIFHEYKHMCHPEALEYFLKSFYPTLFFYNAYLSFNVFEFVRKYLSFNIGEITESYIGNVNNSARSLLHDIIESVEINGQMKKDEELLKMVSNFRRGSTFNNNRSSDFKENYNSGNTGIIYTVVDLGE